MTTRENAHPLEAQASSVFRRHACNGRSLGQPAFRGYRVDGRAKATPPSELISVAPRCFPGRDSAFAGEHELPGGASWASAQPAIVASDTITRGVSWPWAGRLLICTPPPPTPVSRLPGYLQRKGKLKGLRTHVALGHVRVLWPKRAGKYGEIYHVKHLEACWVI